MTIYSQERLGPVQRLKARWRSFKRVCDMAQTIQERESLGAREAAKVAAQQHNRTVQAMREREQSRS